MNGAIAFTAGVALGDVVWLTFAILGLAVVAQTFQGVFLVIKYAGAAYLLYLAWKLWTAPVVAHDVAPDTSDVNRTRLFLAGLAVTLATQGDGVLSGPAAQHHRSANGDDPGLAGAVARRARRACRCLWRLRGARCPHAPLFTSPRAMRLVNRGTGA